ncbi:MAG: DUF726 domain-containing protein [Haloarculaceae archaeon]
MTRETTRGDGGSGDRGQRRVGRRTFLRSGAVAAAGLGGLSAATGSAAAVPSTDAYPRISTRGHFQGGQLVDGETPTSYDLGGDWAGTYDPGSALLVFVHDWQTSTRFGEDVDRVRRVQRGLEDAGYAGSTALYTWDADYGLDLTLGWSTAEDVAYANGSKLAAFVRDWTADRGLPVDGGAPLRLVGHGLGARVVWEALVELGTGSVTDAVASASLLGAAVENIMPLAPNDGPEIAAAADRVDNFYSRDDGELRYGFYYTHDGLPALGAVGARGDGPAAYRDHDATDAISGHDGYADPDGGVLDRVVATF